MLRKIKYFVCVLLVLCITLSSSMLVFAEKGDDIDKKVGDGGKATGVGLATWAMMAYTEGWLYTQGSQIAGKQCDCSGLLMLYRSAGTKNGDRTNIYNYAVSDGLPNGSIGSIPRIHGLALRKPGHVGVYLGSNVTLTKKTGTNGFHQGVEKKGNAIDQNDGLPPNGCGSCMLLRDVSDADWTNWCFAINVEYPTKGFVKFNNQIFYYEPTSGKGYSEYVVNCKKTINNKTYEFDANGVCKQSVSDSELAQTTYGVAKSSGGTTSQSSSTSENSSTDNDNNTDNTDNTDTQVAQSTSSMTVEERSQLAAEKDLTYEQQVRVDEINRQRSMQQELGLWSDLYTVMSLLGIILLVYSLLLLLAFYIDIFNSFSDFSFLRILTFGKMYAIGSKSNQEFLGDIANGRGTVVYATHATIWASFCIGVIAASLLMNMQSIVLLFINLASWFDNLLHNGIQ